MSKIRTVWKQETELSKIQTSLDFRHSLYLIKLNKKISGWSEDQTVEGKNTNSSRHVFTLRHLPFPGKPMFKFIHFSFSDTKRLGIRNVRPRSRCCAKIARKKWPSICVTFDAWTFLKRRTTTTWGSCSKISTTGKATPTMENLTGPERRGTEDLRKPDVQNPDKFLSGFQH